MSNAKSYVVAVVGATGAVGREMLKTLEARKFPISRLVALASKRSAGQKLPLEGRRDHHRGARAEVVRGRRHRALQRRRERVARVRPDRREGRRGRDRQLERMAHGPRGARSSCPRSTWPPRRIVRRGSSPTRTARPSRWSSRSSRCTTPRGSSTSSCRPTRRRAARATLPSRISMQQIARACSTARRSSRRSSPDRSRSTCSATGRPARATTPKRS